MRNRILSNMRNTGIRSLLSGIRRLYKRYFYNYRKHMGFCDKTATVTFPLEISNPENVFLYEDTKLVNATVLTKNARFHKNRRIFLFLRSAQSRALFFVHIIERKILLKSSFLCPDVVRVGMIYCNHRKGKQQNQTDTKETNPKGVKKKFAAIGLLALCAAPGVVFLGLGIYSTLR